LRSCSLLQVLHEGGQGSGSGVKHSVAVQRSAHLLQKGTCSQDPDVLMIFS